MGGILVLIRKELFINPLGLGPDECNSLDGNTYEEDDI